MIPAAVRAAITAAIRRARSALHRPPPDPVLLAAIDAEDAAIWTARTMLRDRP